jgi:hypothetical protein
LTERKPHRHPHGQAQGRATHGEEDAALKDEKRGGKDTPRAEEEEERRAEDSSPSADPVKSPGIRRVPRADG